MLEFKPSTPLTMGVELELQIVNRRDYNLTRGAADLLALINKQKHGYDIKPEITEGMIEIATSVHTRYDEMLAELAAMRSLLAGCADQLNLGLAGGGTHAFQHWDDQRIYHTDRYKKLSDLYGYLAKQFTVYGQHIHIGCPDGDQAVRLLQLMGRYIPHFIALSASSPFSQGADTQFQSSRLTSVNAFPLSGTMPFIESWDAFERYFDKMQGLKIVATMKDFYWDIRPKPEYGTIEIRVCDTPLTIETAAALAAYAQTLAAHFFAQPDLTASPDAYLTYSYNRFQASRFGLAGVVVDPAGGDQIILNDDILYTLGKLEDTARGIGTADALAMLRQRIVQGISDADWLRERFRESGSLSDVARQQSELWMGTA